MEDGKEYGEEEDGEEENAIIIQRKNILVKKTMLDLNVPREALRRIKMKNFKRSRKIWKIAFQWC